MSAGPVRAGGGGKGREEVGGRRPRSRCGPTGRSGFRGGGSQRKAEKLGPVRGPPWPSGSLLCWTCAPRRPEPPALCPPASARVSRLQLGQARSPVAAAPAPNARRPPGSLSFLPSPSSPLATLLPSLHVAGVLFFVVLRFRGFVSQPELMGVHYHAPLL